MFEKKCCNGGKKHNFEPRYEEVPLPNPRYKISNFHGNIDDLRSLSFFKVYLGDRCSRCGKFLKKDMEGKLK